MSFDADAYAARVAAMSNRDLVREAGHRILGAAVMAKFRIGRLNDGSEDARCDLLYAEAVRRGNVDLYQRGFNDAARSQGHTGLCSVPTTPIEVGEPS